MWRNCDNSDVRWICWRSVVTHIAYSDSQIIYRVIIKTLDILLPTVSLIIDDIRFELKFWFFYIKFKKFRKQLYYFPQFKHFNQGRLEMSVIMLRHWLGLHLFFYDTEGKRQYKRKQTLIEEIERKVRSSGSNLFRDWIDRIERRQPIWRNIANLSERHSLRDLQNTARGLGISDTNKSKGH